MAKTVNCAFCGKEITKGLFKGESKKITFGNRSIDCCEECNNKYHVNVLISSNRFSTKLDNIIRTAKVKLTEKQIAEMFVKYITEEAEYKEKYRTTVLTKTLNSFSFDDNNCFSVREYGKGFMNQDITAESMIRSAENAQIDTGCTAFSKDDITKIEYAKECSGDFNGLFQKVYSFAIRLNDEKVMTYKPCITRVCSYGGGFGFGYQRNAEKRLVKILNEFKNQIGSDLPIVKVRKI